MELGLSGWLSSDAISNDQGLGSHSLSGFSCFLYEEARCHVVNSVSRPSVARN